MIKRIMFAIALLFVMNGISKASWWDDRPDQFTVTFSSAAAASISTTVVMVPLSSATAAGVPIWPHPLGARAIVVDSIQIDNDKTAATTSIIKVGVVREINVSSGTIVWFERMGNGINVSNTNNFQYVVYPDGGLNCRVNPRSPNFGASLGSTPYILSNDTLTATTITTGLPLPSVADGTPQAIARVGDIVLNIVNSAVASNFTVVIRYHLETQ